MYDLFWKINWQKHRLKLEVSKHSLKYYSNIRKVAF